MEILDKDYPHGREIKIECSGNKTFEYWQLIEMQGNLKTLHRHDYERMKERILELGFSEPISVWMHRGKAHILNGHQRLRTIKEMVENEKYIVKPLPVNLIQAKDWNEAKRKILSLTSQFGKTKAEGLFNFLKDSDITPQELLSGYKFADLDLVDWVDDYFKKTEPDENDLGAVEPEPEVANPDEEEKMRHGGPIPAGHVRMMQMILEREVANDFMMKVERLKTYYGTDNVTDTVINAVKDLANENIKLKKAKS